MKKGEFRVTNFMYGMIISIGVFSVIWLFISAIMGNYNIGVPDNYNTTFRELSNTTSFDNTVQELKSSAFKDDSNESITTSGNILDRFDILGLYFKLGYETLGLAPKSINTFAVMSDTTLDSNNKFLGSAAPVLQFIVISVIIIAFIGLLIAVAVKWWI